MSCSNDDRFLPALQERRARKLGKLELLGILILMPDNFFLAIIIAVIGFTMNLVSLIEPVDAWVF